MRNTLFLIVALCCAASASAHDFWLQPQRFATPVGAVVPMTLQVGHGVDRQRWGADLKRVTMLRSIGPAGAADRRATLGTTPTQDAAIGFATPGTHMVALQTSHAQSDLPAVRFDAYLAEEGLTPAIVARGRTATRNGREIYSRRAKTLVRVGTGGESVATRPVGLTLEIVPERDPYALAPREPLPVRVYYEGRPLAGALVKLTNLDADEKPVATRRTDAAGRTRFDVPRTGNWLVNVVWTKPIANDPRGDFDTTFSSLTFGFPRAQ